MCRHFDCNLGADDLITWRIHILNSAKIVATSGTCGIIALQGQAYLPPVNGPTARWRLSGAAAPPGMPSARLLTWVRDSAWHPMPFQMAPLYLREPVAEAHIGTLLPCCHAWAMRLKSKAPTPGFCLRSYAQAPSALSATAMVLRCALPLHQGSRTAPLSTGSTCSLRKSMKWGSLFVLQLQIRHDACDSLHTKICCIDFSKYKPISQSKKA